MTTTTIPKTCLVADCARVFHCKGYCKLHYERFRIHGDPLATQHRTTCSVDGCPREHDGRGYCEVHRRRWLKHGDALANTPIRRSVPPAEAFWLYVDKTPGQGPKGECWEWQRGRLPKGYGAFQTAVAGKKVYLATHYVWFLTHGALPDLQILHSCDNPPCVNPDHLREGTNADNVKDKMERGRQPRGEKCAIAKLSDSQVVEIKELIRNGRAPKDIAPLFNISPAVIFNIRAGIIWKHVQ